MPSSRALPDLVARLRLDTSDVERAVSSVNASGSQLAAGFEKAAVGAGKLETAQGHVISVSGAMSKSHAEAASKMEQLETATKKGTAAFGEYGDLGERLTGKLSALSGLAGLSGVGIAGAAA